VAERVARRWAAGEAVAPSWDRTGPGEPGEPGAARRALAAARSVTRSGAVAAYVTAPVRRATAATAALLEALRRATVRP
jgi:hypothetical protein